MLSLSYEDNDNISKKNGGKSETLNLMYKTIKSENQSFSFLRS